MGRRTAVAVLHATDVFNLRSSWARMTDEAATIEWFCFLFFFNSTLACSTL
jgi:hypothetical protein